jgi:hypothetical protein
MEENIIKTIYSDNAVLRCEIAVRADGTFQARVQKRLYDDHLDDGYIWIYMHDHVHITDTCERAEELGNKALQNLAEPCPKQIKWNLENLTPYEQYAKILRMAGWYEGRQEDVKKFEELARANNMPFTSAMQQFLQEFGELNAVVYVAMKRTPNYIGDADKTSTEYDFTFNTSYKESLDLSESEEYDEICLCVQEKILCIGEIGYYYPAVCAIGESGKLYFKHDYSDSVEVYYSLLEAVAGELRNKALVYVSDGINRRS